MTPANLKLERLLKEKAQLEAKIQTEKTRHATEQRKQATRRKILIGAYILDKHIKAKSVESLINELDAFLFKSEDRKLFNLPSCRNALLSPTMSKTEEEA